MKSRISSFKPRDRDYPELIRNAVRDCDPGAAEYVYVGVDEGLNDPKVFRMLDILTTNGTIRSGGALWREVRELEDGSKNYIHGGATKRNRRALRTLIGEVGKPVPGISDDDSAILDILITHFLSFGRVVFLTGDKRFNIRGEYFGPLLARHQPPLSLTAIFKEKSGIEEYCAEVSRFLEAGTFGPGFTEMRL
jgi:hypothetical protein